MAHCYSHSNYHIREVQNIELTADRRGWTQIHADKFVPQQTRKRYITNYYIDLETLFVDVNEE